MAEGLRRFASQRRDKAERLKKEDAPEQMATTILERARKAEKLADGIAAKLEKLHNLKHQGKV